MMLGTKILTMEEERFLTKEKKKWHAERQRKTCVTELELEVFLK